MKLRWITKSKRPAHHRADRENLRYEVKGAARSYTARVYRLDAAGQPARMLTAYDDDTANKCIDWCERFARDRTLSQAKADQVRRQIARTPRLKRASYYRHLSSVG